METNLKEWKKISEGKYSFFKHENEIGQLTIHTKFFQKSAEFEIDGYYYQLKHTGFWSNNIEISDSSGKVVLSTYKEKWYSNATTISFESRKLTLNIRNNPLAEYAILDGENEILSYGLKVHDKQVVTKIQTSLHHKSYLLDFYLWYLFAPIARENMGDDLLFLLLSVA